jgi:hypothetical protein
MKYISIKICLVIVALFGAALAAAASDLSDCPSDTNVRWHNCFGTFIWGPESKWAGNKYVGEHQNGTFNGQGTLTFSPESEWAGDKYVGQWKSGYRTGQGTYTFANGDKYVGEFKDGKFNGQGTVIWPDGAKYVGQWKENKKHGQGTLTYANGTVEEGIWKDDEFQYAKTPTTAVGTCLTKASLCSNTLLCGLAAPDVTNGKKAWFSSSSIYYKYVVEAKKRGLSCGVVSVAASNLPNCSNTYRHNCFGTYTWENGSKYVGEWKYGKKNGHGFYVFLSGNKYVGEFKDDEYNGQGTFTFANGTVKEGIWKDNEFRYHKAPTKPSSVCSLNNLNACSDDLVCQRGSRLLEGKRYWDKRSKWIKWSVEAKKRGLTCGVGSSSSTTKIPSVCSLNDLNACSDALVCSRGSRLLEGKRYWDKRSKWIKWSVEAKKRGLSCGVFSVAASDLSDCPSDTNVRWHNCFGTYTWSDGEKYVGEWKDNKRTGQGTYTWPSGNKYVGEYNDGKRTGQGTFTWPSGNKYVGEYKDGKKNGQGTFTYSPNGEWAGQKYVGEFKDGKRTGQGTFTWPNGEKYVGEFKDGKKNGQGTMTWSDGEKYVGEYNDGNRTGQGTYTWPSGNKYVGEFKDGNFNGQGTFTHADGKVEEGTWKDDKLDGQATVTYADGTVKEGIWKDDEFQYAKAPTKPVPVVKTPTQDDQAIPASSGSGFAVSSDGYVITNSHVIEGCQDVVIHTPLKDIKMRVVSNDPKNDLALLKGNFTPLAVFSLSTERPEILQDIYVAGYPFGYKVSSSVKVTKGIISSLTGIGNDFSNFQIDAALQSGNSGGPILDDMGNVVGVAVAKLDLNIQILKNTANIPENTNFGIKASVVKSVLDSSSVDTPSANKSAISKSQLGKMITNGTYYISCWMTLAQIEKVRSKKVLFSELD